MKRLSLAWRLGIATLIAFFGGVTLVGAFAEEGLPFIDPATGVETDEQISTIHDDLTYAMAQAAGFSEADSRTLQIYDQLVDSEQLGLGAAVTYSNCTGVVSPAPDPSQAAVCPEGDGSGSVTWPMWESMKDQASCATSRFGPYMPLFHFPHQNEAELGALREWGWGRAQTLNSVAVFAWGGKVAGNVLGAACTYQQPQVVETGLIPGSLPAFATYLHSLADSYSHLDCLAALAERIPPAPWGTHTLPAPLGEDIYECNYNPNNPKSTDAHGREFGTAYPSDSDRTVTGILAVYNELVLRSGTREGQFRALPLNTALTVNGSLTTLQGALTAFIKNYTFENPGARRDYAASLANAVRPLRIAVRYLPAVFQ